MKFIDSYRQDETTDEDGKMATENDDTKELLLTRLDRVQSRSGEAAMKSTEADGNALQTLGSSPTKTMTGNPVQLAAVQPDIRRRRLVRGVAAGAPRVLTLRSGALAAASCTGAKIVSIGDDGLIINPDGMHATDVCFTEQQVCEGYSLVLDEPTKIKSGNFYAKVTLNPSTPSSPTTFSCGNLKSTNVAILSSASASSLTA